jgi:hypothetical protein
MKIKRSRPTKATNVETGETIKFLGLKLAAEHFNIHRVKLGRILRNKKLFNKNWKIEYEQTK